MGEKEYNDLLEGKIPFIKHYVPRKCRYLTPKKA